MKYDVSVVSNSRITQEVELLINRGWTIVSISGINHNHVSIVVRKDSLS